MENADGCADGVAIGLRADKPQSEAAVAGLLVVAEQYRRSVVRRHQQIDIAVAVEVAGRQSPPDAGLCETIARLAGRLAKDRVALVEEEQRRLRVTDVAADVAYGLVDVAVGDDEIDLAVEIEIGKPEAETIERRCADAGSSCDVLVESLSLWPIEADHFVVEVGDREAGATGVVEVSGVYAHARARLAVIAERDTG